MLTCVINFTDVLEFDTYNEPDILLVDNLSHVVNYVDGGELHSL